MVWWCVGKPNLETTFCLRVDQYFLVIASYRKVQFAKVGGEVKVQLMKNEERNSKLSVEFKTTKFHVLNICFALKL